LKDENFFMLARGNPTRDYFEQSFHDHHLEPRTIDFNNIDIIKSKVIANEGISVMASGQFKVEAKLGYLRGISLPEIKFRRHFYEIHHKDLHILPHIQSYLDTCMFRSITEFSCLNGTLF
jgi:DNA-binding transcriptional LysR family regulator